MIFKTFQSDLDGISNKLGFSKRSFAEWGKQVSTSFKESEGVVNRLKNALKTAFTVPVEKDNGWTKNSFGAIVNKENIDSFIPELVKEDASDLAQRIREQSIAVANATDGWEDYFEQLKKNKQDYIVDLIKNTNDLSKLTGEDLVKANQQARAAAIAHNQELKQLTLGAKAAAVGMEILKTACNMIVFTLVAEGIQLAIEWLSSFNNTTEKLKEKIGELSNKYQEYESEIETINQKLEDNKQRIQDILALDTPTYTDEEELKNLEREVELLERRKAVLGRSQDDVAKQKVEAIYEDFMRGYATNDEKFDEAGLKKDTILYTVLTGGAYNIYKTAQAETSKTDREKVEELIESYEELASIRENMLNSGEDTIDITNVGELTGLEGVWDRQRFMGYSIDDIDNKLQSYSSSLEKYYNDFSRVILEISELDPNLESDRAKRLIGMQDRIYRYINLDEWTKSTVENIVKENDKFSALTKRLQEQITSGLTDKELLEQSETDESLQNLIKAISTNLYGKANEESKKKSASYLLDYLKPDDGTPIIPFSEAFNAKEFASAKEKLLNLATSGELSADTISSTAEYKILIDKTGLSAKQLVEKIKEFNIKDTSDNIQYLEGILSDIQSGKTLNLSQASELISENESLAGSIKKVGDSYTVEEEALKSLINSSIEKYNTAVSIQNEETKNAIKESEKRIKQYEIEMAFLSISSKFGFNTSATTEQKTSLESKINEEKKHIEELEGSYIDVTDLLNNDEGSASTSQMNFIEILLEKVSKATEKIQKKFEDAFSLSGAKKNFTKALSQIQKEIHTNSSAYAKYMTEANKVGLEKKYITQIQNGSLQIDDGIDSTTYDKIQSYQQWYEKAQACKDTIDSLRESEQSLKESYVDKITEIYDRKAKTYQNRLDTTNGLISMNEDIYGYSSTALYNKAIKDTSINISVYRKELSTLQKEQKKVDRTTNPSLWYKYQDAIVEAKGSIDDLSDSYLSLAKSKAEVSITKRDSKVEKLNATKDLNDSKVDNAIGYSEKNTIINNNIAVEKSILAQYKTAKTESDKLFKNEEKESSTKSFKNTLAKSGIAKSLIAKANTAISKGKKIPATVMNALKKQMSGNKSAESAYKQFVEYNTALDAKDMASSDYSKQKQESKSNIKQHQQQLLDSISEVFDLRIKTVQDKQSLLDAQWDKLEAMGAEKTEQYYKSAIQNTKQENSLLQQERDALQKQLTLNKWDKNSKEYKEAESKLNDINVQIQNNTKSQIEYNNALLNMPIDKLSKALELLESISKANKSITEYYKTVRGYSIESDFQNQINDNLEQIKKQQGLYEWYAQNAANAAASGFYYGKSYEEWMKEAQSAKAAVYDFETENENLKDSLRDEVYLKPFEDMIDYAQRAVDKIKDMESLFSTFDFTLYDDNGNLNEYGLVQMKTSFDKLSKTKTVLSNIVDELKKVDELYANPNSGMNSTEYQEKRIALEDTYNSTLLESAGIMKTITDMMKEQSQQQIDSIKKQIAAYKELLSTQKEENSYQKSIKEKTDTISSLQKRLLSLGNGTTEETQAEYQKVLNELEQAKDDLEQTEWEHYIDLQTQALDDLSESLDDYLSNIDVTLESIADTLQSAKGIVADVDSSELLNKILELVGGDKTIFSGSDTTMEPTHSVTKTDSDDILSANARIREDVARIIADNNLNSAYGYINYVTTSLGKYLDATTNSDKEKYSKELDTYLKNCINLLKQYNNNGNKETIDKINTRLIPYLKQAGINLPSFSQGGTVKLVKRNGDDGLASLKAGEAVFTLGQLELLKKSIDAMETAIPNINDTLQNIKPISNLSGIHENSIGEVNIHLECPAATQEELYQWLQSSKTQKIIQSSVIDPIMGNGTLGRFRY